MFCGKNKAVSFSYDDGVTQDKRLVEILNKYNLKATFNLNFALLGNSGSLVREGVTVSHNKVNANEVNSLYKGHEISSHALHHEILTDLSDEDIVKVCENDRLALSELAGYEVVGFAYPCGVHDKRVENILETKTGLKYARTADSSRGFGLCKTPFTYTGTAYHMIDKDELFDLGERFINMKANSPQLFYIWGHSYEFDIHNTWDVFEEFCKMISNKEDVFYGTNREVLL